MTTMRDTLAPVADALLERARRDVDAITAAADREAAEIVAAARRKAHETITEARARGAAEARAYSSAVRARTRRQARGIELAARREVVEELRRRAAAAVGDLREDPCYPALLRRLAGLIRDSGGDDLVVREHPGGGLVGEGRGRRVDCSLGALAGRAVDAHQPEMERLWAP